jgi:DNA-binding response OmpR family regulator
MAAPKILLADDSSTVRTMISRILTESGFEVITACDGVEAIELAEKYKPSLAILDIVMPDLDGYGVCEKLKQMGKPWSDLPILFLTCIDSKALELLGDEYGAYLRKPVQTETLLKSITEHLPEKEYEFPENPAQPADC